MVKLSSFAVIASLMACSVSFSAIAGDANPYEGTLTGDWNGMRTKLSDKGIELEAVYTVDAMSNVAGGIKRRGEVLDNLDLMATLDGEKLYNVKGSTIFLYVLNNNGGKLNADDVGSVQGVDNIEVGARTAKLYEAWIEQNFMDDKFSVRAGLYDLNSEFYVTESSGLFLNSTFGIGTDFSQSGVSGPSIFPTTSLAVRAKLMPSETSYVQLAVLDAVAGDPNNPQGTHVQFNDNDGVLAVVETGNKFEFAKLAMGGWWYSQRSDDLLDTDSSGAAIKERNYGLYGMVEKDLNDDYTVFLRMGYANRGVNRIDLSWSTGVTINKIIPSREGSQLGFALTEAHNSSKYKTSQRNAGSGVDASEYGVEITYSDMLLPWLRVQPDVQYTVNPGTNPAYDDSLVLGVRFEVAF